MEANFDRKDRSHNLSLLGRYLVVWLVLAVIFGALVYTGQIRQARDEFESHAGAIHREVDTRLKANEIVLDGVAAFLRVAGSYDERALQTYADQVLVQFPQIYQVSLQRRVAADELPRFALQHPSAVSAVEVAHGGVAAGPAAVGVSYLVNVALGPSADLRQAVLGQEAAELLRTTAVQTLQRGRATASRIFRMDGPQGSAFALFRPVYSEEDERYGDLLVSLLVQIEELLPHKSVLPRDVDLRLQHGHYPEGGSTAWSMDGLRTVSALERMLFPRLRAVRVFGTDAQPFVLTIDRQLGWEVIDPLLAASFVLLSSLGLFTTLSYGRSRVRQEDERRRSEQKLYRLANYDSLTELPNRNLFSDRLQQALSRSRRQHSSVALFFLDLDGFKQVNDSAGHASGDRLLQLVAERLLKVVREQDTVARLSGDEFVVLLEGIKSRDDAERVQQQLYDSFIESFAINGFEFMLTASIGLAMYPENGETPEQLLHWADQKMYASKHPEWAASRK